MPEVADNLLPVWTIQPNWSGGVNERLEWLTDLLTASDGNEQSRAMRLSPRRAFECTFTPWDEDRSYFDLWLHRFGSQEFMVPLFHDCARLGSSIAAGVFVLPFDNTNREFVNGGLAIIAGQGPHDFEKVTVATQDENGITLAGFGTARAWPKGTKVYPLRRARLAEESTMDKLSNRVGSATILFELNQANDLLDEGEWTGLEYEGLPVLTDPPNYAETLTTEFMRMAFSLDNDHGLRFLADDAGRAFTVQAHSYQFRGRAQHMAFRKMLYRLRGRANPIWLPTFNQDMRLARQAAAVDNKISIKEIGYGYTGGAVAGRNDILIGGTIPRRITGLSAPLAAGEERLDLSAPLGAIIAKNASASFLAASRMNQDSVEIVHHTDTDGVGECKTSFKQFTNTRVAPDIISTPIPESALNFAFCGAPDESEIVCVPFDNDPPPVFEGWYVEMRLEFILAPYAEPTLGWFMRPLTSGFENGGYKGPPDKVLIPDNGGIIMKFFSNTFVAPQEWMLQMQYFSGSAGPMLARLYARRWDGDEQLLLPKPGSENLADENGYFDPIQIFPGVWYFDF